jgi:hypothetical protein
MANEHPMALFFVRSAQLPDPMPAEMQAFLHSEADGWRWTDVWFSRSGAEEVARRHEAGTIIVNGHDVSDATTTVAEVKSVAEIIADGGHEALGRAVEATQTSFTVRLAQFEAGVRFGVDEAPPEAKSQ